MLDVKEDIMEGINHPNDLLEDETDETEEPEIKNESSGFSKPIYEGGQLTLGASTLLIMSFVIRHSLSGAALADVDKFALCFPKYMPLNKWYFWEKLMMFLHMIHKGHILR